MNHSQASSSLSSTQTPPTLPYSNSQGKHKEKEKKSEHRDVTFSSSEAKAAEGNEDNLENFKRLISEREAAHTWFSRPRRLKFLDDFLHRDVVFLDLQECACGEFNRSQNNRRKNTEIKMREHALANYAPDSEFTLNYLSLGCGGLLQDFLIVGQLITIAKFKKFNIILIEPSYNYNLTRIEFFIGRFAELLQVVANAYGAELNIKHYKQIDELKAENPLLTFHLINGIDFDELEQAPALCASMTAHELLDDKGLFFLSYKTYDFHLTKQGCIEKTYYSYIPKQLKSRKIIQLTKQHIQNNVLDHLNTQDFVTYTSLGHEFGFQLAEIVEILSLLQFSKKGILNLTLRNTLIFLYQKDSASILSALTHFVGLFVFLPDEQIKLSLVSSIDEYLKQSPPVKKPDVITVLADKSPPEEEKTALKAYNEISNFDCEQVLTATLSVKPSDEKSQKSSEDRFFMWQQRNGKRAPLDIKSAAPIDITIDIKSAAPTPVAKSLIRSSSRLMGLFSNCDPSNPEHQSNIEKHKSNIENFRHYSFPPTDLALVEEIDSPDDLRQGECEPTSLKKDKPSFFQEHRKRIIAVSTLSGIALVAGIGWLIGNSKSA